MSSVFDLCQFLNSSPTPFHAVQSIKHQLIDRDFQELLESQLWETMRGGKYYVTRGETSIVAWVQGTRTMTEKRMAANKRKLARKLAQVKRARIANKATA